MAQIHTTLFTTQVIELIQHASHEFLKALCVLRKWRTHTRNLMVTTEDSVSLTGFVLERSRGVTSSISKWAAVVAWVKDVPHSLGHSNTWAPVDGVAFKVQEVWPC